MPLVVVLGLMTVALVSGCKKEEAPASPPAAAPEMPATNAPAQ
jgi:hypothetical protein